MAESEKTNKDPKQPSPQDEELDELIRLAQGGNQSAFGQLCVRYQAMLASMVSSFSTKISEDIFSREDLHQESLMAFYRAAQSYDRGNGAVTFGLYSKTCVKNALISLQRKAISRKRKQSKEIQKQFYNEERATLFSFVDGTEGEFDGQIFGMLTDFEASVLRCYLKRMSYEEIGGALSVGTKSVDNALYRIRKKIKKAGLFKGN